MAREFPIINVDGVEHALRVASVLEAGKKRFVGFAVVPTFAERPGLSAQEKGWMAQGCAVHCQRRVVEAAEGKAKRGTDDTIRLAALLASQGKPINAITIGQAWDVEHATEKSGLAFCGPDRTFTRDELADLCKAESHDLDALIAMNTKR